jgi:uncharacterized membrane protein YkvA (DUF1232 family)
VTVLDRLKQQALRLKTQTYALYLVARDPRTPWFAKLLAGAVVAYALSPIDLIPDFIPVLGYLDDLVLLPLGIWFALKLVPAEVFDDARGRAVTMAEGELPASRGVVVVIVAIWLLLAALAVALVYRLLPHA